MQVGSLFWSILLLLRLSNVHARCPNDCSSNGKCVAGSTCNCFENFMGNDCSQRLCAFGRAFVDTPLGDINSNDQIDIQLQSFKERSSAPVLEMYGADYGLARENNTVQWDEAHFYRECSNRGDCNRRTGVCSCYPGYEGASCQRIACNNKCSGHGQCVLTLDSNPGYEGWDAEASQQCVCDGGYFGADCSQRKCAIGVDPFLSKFINSDSVYKLEFEQKTGKFDGTMPNGELQFTLTYTDDDGEPWTTDAMTLYYQAASSSKWSPEAVNGQPSMVSTPFYRKTHDGTNHLDIRNKDILKELYEGDLYSGANFIAEQVNASLQALPNDIIRNSKVWVVRNEQSIGNDLSFVYPARSVPDFTFGTFPLYVPNDDARIGFPKCALDNSAGCAPYSFDNGPSIFVNDRTHRFPFWVKRGYYNTLSKGKQKDSASVAAAILNCKANALCLFISIPEAKGSKSLSATYRFRPNAVVLTGSPANSSKSFPITSTQSFALNEITGQNDDANNIVKITEVGADREYYEDIDGSPPIEYKTAELHECSKRGICNYDTGKCTCFAGFADYRCGSISSV